MWLAGVGLCCSFSFTPPIALNTHALTVNLDCPEVLAFITSLSCLVYLCSRLCMSCGREIPYVVVSQKEDQSIAALRDQNTNITHYARTRRTYYQAPTCSTRIIDSSRYSTTQSCQRQDVERKDVGWGLWRRSAAALLHHRSDFTSLFFIHKTIWIM